MLSSCELDRHIIIFWVRQTHRHAIIILWVWHVSSSDTSARYHHLVSLTCEFVRHIGALSSSCEFNTCEFVRHICLLSSSCGFDMWVRKTHLPSFILSSTAISSSCEFDRNIGVLSSSCELDRGMANEKFTPPKRRFWTAGRAFCRPFRMRFRSTFLGCEYLIWATKRWKVLRKRILKGLQKVRPAVQNLRLGSIKLRNFAPTT